MTSLVRRRWVAVLGALALATAACGSSTDDGDDDAAGSSAGDEADPGGEQPTIVVTTNILGDVVGELVGDQANVVTIMPVGADPHDFQASAQEIDRLLSADALVVNGADFEAGLLDVIETARGDGVLTHAAMETVDAIEFDGHDHGDDHDGEDHADDDHADDDHADDDHADGDHADGDHAGDDPHFFTDPMRMAAAVEGVASFLADAVGGIDASALRSSSDAYVAELEALDADVQAMVDSVAEDRRTLVTNHEVFGYFADRYGFEVVGVIVPGGSTTEGVSPADLAALAEVIAADGVPAIFADTSSSDELAETLATEVGDIAVVELYSESLRDADSDGATYLDVVRTNAERITDAHS